MQPLPSGQCTSRLPEIRFLVTGTELLTALERKSAFLTDTFELNLKEAFGRVREAAAAGFCSPQGPRQIPREEVRRALGSRGRPGSLVSAAV